MSYEGQRKEGKRETREIEINLVRKARALAIESEKGEEVQSERHLIRIYLFEYT